jgi:3-hydroxyisobutyrate dehydrogenase-like beta-hydroxyacid dehydrogenase
MAEPEIRIGVIGLGRMGKPIARNLLRAGYRVTVHNRSQPPVAELTAEGAVDGGSAAGVAAVSDMVLTSLPDPAAVRDVYLADAGLLSAAQPGQIFLDTSTIDPGLTRQLASACIERGAQFLDAPISGGVAGAEAASLTVMVGGEADAFSRAEPILAVIGQKVHHVGPSGAGTIIKLANQLLVGIHMAAAAEALVLGVKAGADPEQMLEVISTSFGSSRMLERGGPMIVNRNFSGGTPVEILRKDLGLIADLAAELGVPLATGDVTRQVFDRAHAANLGNDDITAIVRPIETVADVEVKRQPAR